MYVSSGHDLVHAASQYFEKYVESELKKGYRGPTYPHKLWTTIFEVLGQWSASNFLDAVGFVKPGTKIYAGDYCEDLTLLRTRLDDFKMAKNSTEYLKKRNENIEKMKQFFIKQYF